MSYCNECAIKIFGLKHYNLKGVGNPFYGKCIVVPNVDYNAYKKGDMSFSTQVEIINDTLSSTGVQDFNIYILPLIRCNEKITCKLDYISYYKCLHYFIDDMIKYNFKDILLLGGAARRFLNVDITQYLNTIIISKHNRRYAVNYAPFIKYIDNNKFNIFKENLIKWYNAINTETFNMYNILTL